MEHRYWLGRAQGAERMARTATSSTARLAHYQLSGIYTVKALSEARVALEGARAW